MRWKPSRLMTAVLATGVFATTTISVLAVQKNTPRPALETPTPKLLYRVEPVYPAEARTKGIQGSVVLQITVSENGTVTAARALSGPEPLREAAVQAVKKWKYEPSVVNGTALSAVTTVTLTFRLRDSTKPQSAASAGPAAPLTPPIRVGGNVQEAKLSHRVEPVYPPDALAARVSAAVILQVTVNEGGEVYEAKVLRGHPLLDASAVDAVRQWRYQPTFLEGVPVPIIATVTLTFAPPKQP